MEALSTLTCKPQLPLRLSLHRPRLLSTFNVSLSSYRLPSLSIRACNSTHANPNSKPRNAFTSSSVFAFLKLPLSLAVTAAAVFLAGLRPFPAVALPPVAETMTQETPIDVEAERILEEEVANRPNDVQAVKSLLELKIRSRKFPEVVEIASKLIELEPDEVEWRLLTGHMYCYMGQSEMAKPVFEEIVANDPYRVEAYHGLVMSCSQSEVDPANELIDLEKRIQDAIVKARKEKKKDVIREFQLLIAQIRVIDGDYMSALKIYQDLVKEEPRDYRPYLCQGIIYTLLRKKDQAEEQFAKYKRLAPKGHPYASLLEETVNNTSKVFSDLRDK